MHSLVDRCRLPVILERFSEVGVDGRRTSTVSWRRSRAQVRRETPWSTSKRGRCPGAPRGLHSDQGSRSRTVPCDPNDRSLVGAASHRRLSSSTFRKRLAGRCPDGTVVSPVETWSVLANTVMELTATFAACAAVPRTCFRMSAAHHHVGLARKTRSTGELSASS